MTSPSPLRRAATVARVAGRHALAHWLGRGERGGRLARLVRRLVPRRRLPVDLSGPERLRTAFEELGGTFIKLGQMLALQPDILSLEYCNALFKLLDRVEPFPYEDVERTFVEDLGRTPDRVFDRFEPASFAAASVGQVHRAWLGERKLAVKVRRPTVLQDFAGDLRLMRATMAVIRRFRLRSAYWLLEPLGEFVSWTEEELDYRIEARYLERQRLNTMDNPRERIPEVVRELSGERILVLEFLEGLPVLDHVRALETGDEMAARRLAATGFEPNTFARAIIDNFLTDAFLYGMFHADLHPANLLILPGNVVGYIDFGITGLLSVYSRQHLVDMTLGYSQGDMERMCNGFFKVSTFEPGSDPAEFREGMKRLSESWYDVRGGERRMAKNFTRVMLDMLRLSRGTGVWPERDVVKYIRSAIAIDGLIERFAPEFNVGAYLAEVCSRNLRMKGLEEVLSPQRFLDGAVAGTRLARHGALRGGQVLDRLLSGEMPLRAELAGGGAGARPAFARPAVTACVAVAAALLLRFGGAPAEIGWTPFTAQLAVAVVAMVALLGHLWNPRPRERTS